MCPNPSKLEQDSSEQRPRAQASSKPQVQAEKGRRQSVKWRQGRRVTYSPSGRLQSLQCCSGPSFLPPGLTHLVSSILPRWILALTPERLAWARTCAEGWDEAGEQAHNRWTCVPWRQASGHLAEAGLVRGSYKQHSPRALTRSRSCPEPRAGRPTTRAKGLHEGPQRGAARDAGTKDKGPGGFPPQMQRLEGAIQGDEVLVPW